MVNVAPEFGPRACFSMVSHRPFAWSRCSATSLPRNERAPSTRAEIRPLPSSSIVTSGWTPTVSARLKREPICARYVVVLAGSARKLQKRPLRDLTLATLPLSP